MELSKGGLLDPEFFRRNPLSNRDPARFELYPGISKKKTNIVDKRKAELSSQTDRDGIGEN